MSGNIERPDVSHYIMQYSSIDDSFRHATSSFVNKIVEAKLMNKIKASRMD
jgi:hypothetical protein